MTRGRKKGGKLSAALKRSWTDPEVSVRRIAGIRAAAASGRCHPWLSNQDGNGMLYPDDDAVAALFGARRFEDDPAAMKREAFYRPARDVTLP